MANVNLIASTDISITQSDSDISLNVNKDSSVSTSSTKAVENQAITNYVDTQIGTLATNFNTFKTYSTTEQVIGTWVNNKPLYRQVLHKVMSSTSDNLIGTISDVDLIIVGGNSVAKWDSGGVNYYTGSVNSYESNSNFIKIYNMINSSTHECNVRITCSEKAELWIECLYTKTTD